MAYPVSRSSCAARKGRATKKASSAAPLDKLRARSGSAGGEPAWSARRWSQYQSIWRQIPRMILLLLPADRFC